MQLTNARSSSPSITKTSFLTPATSETKPIISIWQPNCPYLLTFTPESVQRNTSKSTFLTSTLWRFYLESQKAFHTAMIRKLLIEILRLAMYITLRIILSNWEIFYLIKRHQNCKLRIQQRKELILAHHCTWHRSSWRRWGWLERRKSMRWDRLMILRRMFGH